MRRVWVAIAIPLMLSCARGGAPREAGRVMPDEGTDPSRDRYLAETFLDRPSSGPLLEAGAGCDLHGSAGTVTRDAWIRIRTRGISGAGRIQVRGEALREAFHLSAVPLESMKFDLGDLVPDFGIGLLSSGRRFTYPFAARHPLYPPAGIRGWTGFYGAFIRGASIRIESGPAALTLISGRTANHGTEGVEYTGMKDVATGVRIAAGNGVIKAGVTTLERGSRSGGRINGLDLTIVSKGRTCVLECAAVPSGSVSAVWGLAVDGNDMHCGMLGWSVPAGADGHLASFPGLSAASDRSRTGASVIMRRGFPRKTHLSAWGELRRGFDGGKRYLDKALKLETGIRWRRGGARCSWSSHLRRSEKLVPFPPGSDADTDYSGGLALSLSITPSRSLALVMEMRRPCGEGGEGALGTVRASLALRSLHSRLKVSASAYRSGRGKARFSLYEPSGAGKYPWKTLYGSGSRLSLGLETDKGWIKASIWLLWTSGGGTESALRLSLAI